MRILHISFSLENAGKENMLVDIAAEQQKLGHCVAIAVINNRVDQSILNRIPATVSIYLLNRVRGSRNPLPFIRLFDILHRRFRPDVVHAHDAHIGGLIRKLKSVRTVLTIHDNGYPTEPMQSFLKLFSISDSVKTDVESRSNLKCTTIYNGINFNSVKNIKRKSSSDSKINLIQVSRLNHHKKGQDILLSAMYNLVSYKSLNNICLTFAGSGESYQFLLSLAQSLNLQNHLIFLGNKPREWIYDNLCDYDIFVQPSRFEGFGLALVEALAAKLIAVSSDNTGSAEVLDNGKYGILFKNGDHMDLVDKIQSAIELITTNESAPLVEEAYGYVKNKYNIQKTAAAYLDNYS